MSSYLTFYLVPKKTKNRHDGIEVELSTGTPLQFLSYPRNSEVYQQFNDSLNVAYIDSSEGYTELTIDKCKAVIDNLKGKIKSFKHSLEINYKILKANYNFDLVTEIHSVEDHILELELALNTIKHIYNIVYECTSGYNDFEKVLINID